MKYFFVTALVLLSHCTFSQDCSKESLRQKTGTWKSGQQGSIKNVTAADLAKEKAVLTGIHKMITAQHTPTGCVISYSTVYGKSTAAGENWVADPYHYALYI